MTTYHLSLNQAENPPVDVAAPPAARPSRVLASLVTEDAGTMAATLRALADRLDPPGPVWRDGAVALDPPHLRKAEPAYRDRFQPEGYEKPPVEPWMRRQAAQIDAMVCPDCTDDHHTHEFGRCALKPDMPPMYAHDPECNTLHDGPDPCPPPVTVDVRDTPPRSTRTATLTPAAAEAVARVDADRRRITLDGCGPEHTFTGSCVYARQGRPD